MKYLVTGGAGFIGRHLVADLIKNGSTVTVVDSGYTGQISLLPEGVKLIKADIADISEEQWSELLKDIDVVFHLAARKYNTPGVTAEQIIDSNVTATWKLAEAASLAKVSKFVFTSSLYAYGSLGPKVMSEEDLPTPITLYGASKLMGENILRSIDFKSGLNWAVARLLFVYGPGQFAEGGYKSVIVTNFENIKNKNSPTICGDGQQQLDYVYVQDVVEGLKAMSDPDSPKAVANLSTGRAINIVDLTSLMLFEAGSDLHPRFVPADWTAGTSRVGNPKNAELLFGWKPTTTLELGLQLTWASEN